MCGTREQPQSPANYKYKATPEIPIRHILESLAAIGGNIEYVVIKLDTVRRSLQAAPCGILYNYFSCLLLRHPLCYYPRVELFVGSQDPEYHNMTKFDGYIEGKTGIERAEKGKDPLQLLIRHYHAKSGNECKAGEKAQVEFGLRGLEAADFICWAIKKKYENKDKQWYSVIEKKIRCRQQFYGQF